MALNLVKKFRDLAEVEANRPVIVRDQGCLPLLLSHISSSDSDIVIVALEGINFLSMCPSNIPLMKHERGLVSLVQILQTHSRPEIKSLSKSIIANLDQKSTQTNKTPRSRPSTPLGESSNTSTPSTGGSTAYKKRARTITVYIPDLANETQRKALSAALLNVKGVISFLIDLYAQKAVIRTSSSSSFLVSALQESFDLSVSLTQHAPNSSRKLNVPDYLPDSDDEDENVPNSYGTLTKKTVPNETEDTQWNGGWGLGRIAKALWG